MLKRVCNNEKQRYVYVEFLIVTCLFLWPSSDQNKFNQELEKISPHLPLFLKNQKPRNLGVQGYYFDPLSSFSILHLCLHLRREKEGGRERERRKVAIGEKYRWFVWEERLRWRQWLIAAFSISFPLMPNSTISSIDLFLLSLSFLVMKFPVPVSVHHRQFYQVWVGFILSLCVFVSVLMDQESLTY